METFTRGLIFAFFLITPVAAAGEATEAWKKMQSGSYAEAAELWRKIIGKEPEHVTAINYLGYSQLMLGEYDTAAETYQKADAISENLDSKAGAQWALLAGEKYGDSIPWGKAALNLDPANFWVRRRLALAYEGIGDTDTADKFTADLIEVHGTRALTGAPLAQVIPVYQQINFSGSSKKTSGFDAGALALWNFNSGVTLGGGYARNVIANPASADGYNTNEFKLMSGFVFSDLSSLTLTSHVLSSNYSYLDNAVTFSATYRPGLFSRFVISADALIFPAHGGAALSPQYNLPLGRYLTLGLGGQVQAIGFVQTMKLYGAASAALTFCASGFCLGVGGLAGQLYTPLFDGGAILTYSLDQLTSQAFAKLSWQPTAWFAVSAAYTYGQWSSFTNESPVSNTISFTATGSLW